MGEKSNEAPIIIKRKKVVSGGGHHGGAWKVAYADFVTAMMAFFMLMWLLNATTEKQRKGLADYFSPTIPINRVSGGGSGAFGGDSIFSEEQMAQSGTGASQKHPTEQEQASGEAASQEEQSLRELDTLLQGLGGESAVMENALRHIVTRLTDEGLVIELFEREDAPLFEDDAATATALLRTLATLIASTSLTVTNKIAVGGHVRASPVVLKENPAWDLSTARAATVRQLLQTGGIPPERMERITGHADRKPVANDPMARRNNRIEVILLRSIKRN